MVDRGYCQNGDVNLLEILTEALWLIIVLSKIGHGDTVQSTQTKKRNRSTE